MLPSSVLTFISLTHAPSTPQSVLVARAMETLMASSKLVSDAALNSVTRAMLMVLASLTPSLPLNARGWSSGTPRQPHLLMSRTAASFTASGPAALGPLPSSAARSPCSGGRLPSSARRPFSSAPRPPSSSDPLGRSPPSSSLPAWLADLWTPLSSGGPQPPSSPPVWPADLWPRPSSSPPGRPGAGVLFGRRSHRGTPTRQRRRLDLVCGRSDHRGNDPSQRLRRIFVHGAERFAGYGVGRLVRLLDLGTWGGSRHDVRAPDVT